MLSRRLTTKASCATAALSISLCAALAGAQQCSPTHLGQVVGFSDDPRAVQARDGIVYFAIPNDDGVVVDATDPTNPQIIASLPGASQDLLLVGDTLYALGNRLVIFDVTDPASPVVLGTLPRNGTRGIDIEGSIVVFAQGRYFVVADVANPAAPVEVDRRLLNDNVRDVEIVGPRLYVANDTDGVVFYNIDDPDNLRRVTTLPLGFDVRQIEVKDNILYACGYSGFSVVDVTNLAAPVVLGGLDLAGAPRSMQIVGDALYVASYFTDLSIVDLQVPDAPRVAQDVLLPERSVTLFIDSVTAYIGHDATGCHIVDVTGCPDRCAVDLNADGLVTTQDLLIFLGLWAQSDSQADWNGDNTVNTQDFLAYLNDWVAGC